MTAFLRGGAIALALAAIAPCARADFAISVTPPRFELSGGPGETTRQVLEISNASSRAASLNLRTADWSYGQDGTVTFYDALQPDSCRPWVAIERRKLALAARQTWRFRFEVKPPAQQQPTECRFAILIEGDEPAAAGPGGSLPVAGRIAVIVYVGVGDVRPEISLLDARVEARDGRLTPMILVRNTGTAHGRLEGFLQGIDAQGRTYDVAPSSFPVLAGESRWLSLAVAKPGSPEDPVTPQFPLRVRGRLEWGDGRSTELEQRFTP